jgi:para-aminobenzoate synthetase component 1
MTLNKRKSTIYPFKIDPLCFIEQEQDCVSLLNSNSDSKHNILAWGIDKELKLAQCEGAFDKLKQFQSEVQDWMIGYLSYDLKNDVEQLESSNEDKLDFPVLHFYVPQLLIEVHKEFTKVESLINFPQERIDEMMLNAQSSYKLNSTGEVDILFHGLNEEEYLMHFSKLAEHIQKGDIYEVNFCLQFYREEIQIDPLATYLRLNEQTKAPFSVFYRNDQHYILCGSPERFLKKEGNRILSQPIKGTIRRGGNEEEDALLKEQLRNDPKEQGENVMIVDLVRNDLSRIANKGSVVVDELFGVHSFKSVHQLISSITCTVDESKHPVDIIRAAFPMGSMTGAPKIRALQIIEENENFKRGVYSGAFGYINPSGDFDFNVVIRSILYNERKKVLSFPVGGAITALANGPDEYHECILKAKAMKKALQNN